MHTQKNHPIVTGFGLRDLTEDDLPILFEHQREPEASLMAAFPPRERDAFNEHWKSKVFGNESTLKKGITLDEHLAGCVLSWEQSGKRLIGYWIGKEYWGKGLATRALEKFLRQLAARPLYAYVARHNIASIRVLEKCGFRVESRGTLFSKVHGCEIDEVLMVLGPLPTLDQSHRTEHDK